MATANDMGNCSLAVAQWLTERQMTMTERLGGQRCLWKWIGKDDSSNLARIPKPMGKEVNGMTTTGLREREGQRALTENSMGTSRPTHAVEMVVLPTKLILKAHGVLTN